MKTISDNMLFLFRFQLFLELRKIENERNKTFLHSLVNGSFGWQIDEDRGEIR
jgi:hypothetical protein